MNNFMSLIEGLQGPIVIVRSRERDVDILVHEARTAGDLARVMRGRRSTTVKSYMQEVAAAFQFPYYFGENWSAFNDCINDITWLLNARDETPIKRIVFAITEADLFLRDENEDQFETFLKLIEISSKEWPAGNNDQIVRTGRGKVGRGVEFLALFHLDMEADVPAPLTKLLESGKASQYTLDPLDDTPSGPSGPY